MYLSILIGWLYCNAANALVLDRGAVQDALADADWVGEIQVQSRLSRQKDGEIHTVNTATVERTLHGPDRDTIEFVTRGGEVDGIGSFYSGLPRAYVGRRYRIYLKDVAGAFRVAGWEAGLVDLDPRPRAFSRNRTDGSDGAGDGAFLYWRKNYFPLPYFIARDTFANSPRQVREIDRSFNTWRDVSQTLVDFIPMGCIDGGTNLNDGFNTILRVDRDWRFDTSAIAITRNFYIAGDTPDAGLILDSDILLNAQDHVFDTDGDPNAHDIRNIVTHEVGHFMGLGHEITPTDSTATMFAQASTGEMMKRTLETNDEDGLRNAYGGVTQKPSQWVDRFPSCAPRDAGSGCLLVRGARAPNFFSSLLLLVLWVGCFWVARTSAASLAQPAPASQKHCAHADQ